MSNFVSTLRGIEKEMLRPGGELRFTTKVCNAEREERLRLGLSGYDAIKHYNDWMARYGLHHLIK